MISFRNLALYSTSLLFLLAVVKYAIIVSDYGFWRHDAWGYTRSEHNEFLQNGRWLTTLLHHYLKYIPHYVAWCMSIILYWYVGYAVSKKYLLDLDDQSRVLPIILPSLLIINPGLLFQLNWPIHSLASISVLAIMAYAHDKVPVTRLIILGTVALYAINQAFVFVTLLFLIPKRDFFSFRSRKEIILQLSKRIGIWLIAIILGWVISKIIQFIAFGNIPPMPVYRASQPATSLIQFIENITINSSLFSKHFIIFASEEGAYLLLLTLIVATIACIRKSSFIRIESIPQYVVLVLFAFALFLSIYIITAPLGVRIPFRTTFIFGPASLCLALALYSITRSQVFVLIAALIYLTPPHFLVMANLNWYMQFSSDVVKSITEIEEVSPRLIKGVVIDVSDLKSNKPWPVNYNDILLRQRLVMENLRGHNRLARAFKELGYIKTTWCGEKKKALTNTECSKLKQIQSFPKCAKTNPKICSGGIIENGYWAVKFSS